METINIYPTGNAIHTRTGLHIPLGENYKLTTLISQEQQYYAGPIRIHIKENNQLIQSIVNDDMNNPENFYPETTPNPHADLIIEYTGYTTQPAPHIDPIHTTSIEETTHLYTLITNLTTTPHQLIFHTWPTPITKKLEPTP